MLGVESFGFKTHRLRQRNPLLCILLIVSLIAFTLVPSNSTAQNEPAIVGFQFRPIFKNKFFNSGNTKLIQNDVSFSVTPKLGYSYGMIVRKPVAKKVSFEGGINYLKRQYQFGVNDLDSSFSTTAEFAIIEYEIPISAMVHVRLSDQIYMNNSAGISMNIFKRSEIELDDDVFYAFNRKAWMNFALIANIGWEYRTDHSGYFYLGSSYQLPFSKIIEMTADYKKIGGVEEFRTEINLGFFTLDLKYYFAANED